MRLKQLKLSGFKSFANPTTFHFPKTITAIVGPNGCGKSNVIDAIRWVLGESSAKQLRGGAMSDVIFAGTQDKTAKSLASVELVFEHTQAEGKNAIHHALNLYHELSVRRQITKDGKSDYFINGTKVRRRDVVDVFLGTGLGARSYAVIEQGMIGRIIDANALQLREFIEEASGVSRYQSRREDTQKQLDTASDNLTRLHDMASELTTQQKRLDKQAKTAKQAQHWQSELDHISKQLLIDDYGQAWQKQQTLTKDFHAIDQTVTAQQAVITQMAAQHQQAQHHINEQQIHYQAQQNLVQRQWQQHFETQSLLNQSQQHIANDQQRLTTLDFECNRLTDYKKDLLEQKQHAQIRIKDVPQQLEQITQQLNQRRDAHHTTKHDREQTAKALATLNQQKNDVEKQLAVSENAIQHLNNQQQRLTKRQQEHTQATTAWHSAKAKFEQDFANNHDIGFDTKIADINTKIEQLESRIIARQEELADQADEVDSLTRQHRQAEQQRHTWQTEQHTLQNLLDKQQRALAKTANNANQMHLAPYLPKLIHELQLTEQGKVYAPMFDILVTMFADWGVGKQQAFSQLSEEKAVFLSPLQTTSNANFNDFLSLSSLIASPKLAIFDQVWLSAKPIDLANYEMAHLLANLPSGHWLLIQTQDDRLILFNKQIAYNVSKGIQCRGENSTGFSQQFTHQARIDELTEQLTQQKPQLDRLTNALQQATISLQEWQAQDRTARSELLALTQQKQTLQNDKLQQEHRYQSAWDQLERDKQRLDSDAKRLAEDTSGVVDNFAQAQADFAQLTQALADLQPQLHQLITKRQAHDEQLTQLTNEQRELEQQQNRLTQSLATGQLQITASDQQLVKAEQDTKRLQDEQAQLAKKIREQTERLPQLQQQLSEQAENLKIANLTLEQHSQHIKALAADFQTAQANLQEAQQQLATLQQQRHTIDTALALANQNLALIAEQLTTHKLTLPSIDNLTLLTPNERKNLQYQTDILKTQLSELGAVNYSAVAELNEVNARLEPLAEQINDLTASIAKLQQAIKQIDTQTKQLFMDMLSQVNVELNNLFTQVFGGGQAQLVLSDEGGNGWQSGLELMAQPKGKKNSRLALLSGGEKTLTALSLIFAIFKQQPAPFCVLDEVDAPLDDANVERFTRLIEELAKDVQFIFISHNKLAMQIADELKGVTMPTAGVSKLVSVDMSEVADYLAT